MSSRAETRAVVAGKWLLAVVVASSGLALGSLLPGVLVVVSLLAAVACALLWSSPLARISRAARWAVVALVLLTVTTLLQCVPLPAALVRAIAPANADVWERALVPFHEAARAWYPLTVAPAATRVELLRGLFYGCVFLGAIRVASLDAGGMFLERLIVASACAMALSALAHPAVGATKVFGIYTPRDIYAYVPTYYGPLLNTNHLAAYLNIGACVALGVAFSEPDRTPRTLAIGAAVLLAGTSVWAGSRGGTAALVVGLLLTAGLAIYTRRRFFNLGIQAVLAVSLVAAAACLVGLGMSEFARGDLANHDVSKVTMAANALSLVPRFPLVGVGRGAFETIFPSVKEAPLYVTFTHAENVVVQWLVEWGVPVTIAGGLALFGAFRPGVMLRAARPAIGAWSALVVALLHDLVDYHLEVPGVVALLAVCGARVVGSRSQAEDATSRLPFRTSLRHVALAGALAVVPAVAWVIPDARHLLADDRATLGRESTDRALPLAEFNEHLRAAMLRHPSEPYFPLMGAVRAQLDEASVIPWVAGALERSPRLGRAHLVLARSLVRGHAAQARLEYRLAYENEPGLKDTVVAEVPRIIGDFDDALEVVVDGRDGTDVLEKLAVHFASSKPATSVKLDDEQLRRDADARGPALRRAEAALLDVVHQHPWCVDTRACLRDALEQADGLTRRDPTTCASQVIVARLRLAQGDVNAGLDGLAAAIEQMPEPRGACVKELIRLSLEAKQRPRAEAMIDRLVRAGCGAPAECRDLYVWAAGAEEQLGSLVKAVGLLRRACEVAPTEDALYERIGQLGSRAGMFSVAIDAYASLAKRHPGDPRWREHLSELSAKAVAHGLAAPAQ